jgi:hypothetical protein
MAISNRSNQFHENILGASLLIENSRRNQFLAITESEGRS